MPAQSCLKPSTSLRLNSRICGGTQQTTATAATSAARVQDRIADILSGKDIVGTASHAFDGLFSARDLLAPNIVDSLLSKIVPVVGAPGVTESRRSLPALPAAAPRPAPKPVAYGGPGTTVVTKVADLGHLVRAARKRLKLSQQEFGDLAGVGRRFVSELEAGKPTLEIGKVLACAAAAGIDLGASERSAR